MSAAARGGGLTARQRAEQVVAFSTVAIGLGLMAVNGLGCIIRPTVLTNDVATQQNPIPGYHYRIRDRSELVPMLDRPMEEFDLDAVNNAIFGSLVHTDQARIRPYQNWLLWLGGKLYEPLSRTQNPYRIVEGGGGLCHEVTVVMNGIAQRNGLEARIIGLSGHVVSEIKTKDGWRIADPDYGVTYSVGLEQLEGDDGPRIMRDALSDRGYSEGMIERYIRIFQSSHDNVVAETGDAPSPRLALVEKIADWLKWAIPGLLLLAGFVCSKRHID